MPSPNSNELTNLNQEEGEIHRNKNTVVISQKSDKMAQNVEEKLNTAINMTECHNVQEANVNPNTESTLQSCHTLGDSFGEREKPQEETEDHFLPNNGEENFRTFVPEKTDNLNMATETHETTINNSNLKDDTLDQNDAKCSENIIQNSNIITNKVEEMSLADKPIISTVILNNETDSFRSLVAYYGSSSEDDSSDHETVTESESRSKLNWKMIQIKSSSSSDSESDSCDEIDDSDIDTDTDSDILTPNKNNGAIKKAKLNKDNELDILPPVQDLSNMNLNIDHEEFLYMGNIASIIEKLVTVEALPNTPAFDLDSFLFMEDENLKKVPVGQVFDVLGPVTSPLYCIRFNSINDIEKLRLKRGNKIYVAVRNEELTKYVFVKELMRMKGSDASWKDDQECPVEFAEFSDDEEERNLTRSKRNLKRKNNSLERHQQYEQTMNQCNILNTRVSRLMDAHRNVRAFRPSRNRQQEQIAPSFGHHPAPFDPTIPPPMLYTPQIPSPVYGNGFVPQENIRPHFPSTRPNLRFSCWQSPTFSNDFSSHASPSQSWTWKPPLRGTDEGHGRGNHQSNCNRNQPEGSSSQNSF